MRLNAIVLSLILIATETFATPSTQIWIPSTDIQQFMNPHIGWDAYIGQNGKGLVSNGGITLGVLPLKKVGLEAGIDYRDISGDHWSPILLNAKAGSPEDALFKYMPAIAVGVYDLGFVEGVNNYDLLYGLMSRNIGRFGRLSLGGYYSVGDPDLMLDKNGRREPGGLFASWDRNIPEVSDKLWCAVDVQSGTNGYGAISGGLSWLFAPNASMIAGYDYYFNAKAFPGTVTVQVDFNLR